ncbi:hypothetical protein HDU87_001581 [Geranomyces variabilis]|uniref:Uncharacterized protein n=1 Tax=Geranomyces variabilis TaxID=109894 RepID=A0AAD5TPN5_9FUNG|nr:hypothetical protein HDU87_001581 [Geranomyces variabilis]
MPISQSARNSILSLVVGLLLFACTAVVASPQKAPDVNPYMPPANDIAPPPNIDCMVSWSDYSCCASNMKTSTGSVLVTASGNGKQCPISLSRKEYCIVGDKDCSGSAASSKIPGEHLGIALAGVVVALFASLAT